MKYAFSFFALLTMFSASSFASEQPADAEFKYSCQENGPVKACRGLQHGDYASLTLYYNGVLLKSPGLKAYVQVKYMDGTRAGVFEMEPGNLPPYETRATVRITGGCLVGMLGGCKTPGTAEMRKLLEWAQNGYTQTLNALSFEVAFVSDGDESVWDSNGGFGRNYQFNFPEM